MLAPKLVSWRSAEDIQKLKAMFFPEDPSLDNIETKQHALNFVRALQSRGPIPHSIESTALINSAILQDHDIQGPSRGADSYTVRLGYSMALVRFVNGIIDPYQKGQYAISMYTLARNLEMPEAFVELRHQATHEGLPSLKLLQEMADMALDWLWTHYWAVNKLTSDEEKLYSANGDKRLPAMEQDYNDVKELFREYRRLRRQDSVKKITRGDTSELGVKLWAIVKDLKKWIENQPEAVIKVMLEMNVLVPKMKRDSEPSAVQSTAAKLFSPLLLALKDPEFMKRLVMYGLDMLLYVAAGTDDAELAKLETLTEDQEDIPPGEFDTSFCDIWTEWIKYLLRLPPKEGRDYLLSDETARELVDTCIGFPSKWTYDILECYRGTSSGSNNPEYLAQLLKDMKTQISATKPLSGEGSNGVSAKRDIHDLVEDVVTEVAGFEKRIKTLQRGRENSLEARAGSEKGTDIGSSADANSWMLAESWYPRPLGIF